MTPVDPLLALLQDATGEPADDGFSRRVLSALPAQARRRHTHAGFSPAMRAAELAAVGLGSALLLLLTLDAGALNTLELTAALIALVGLLLWWTLPQSRGSAWR